MPNQFPLPPAPEEPLPSTVTSPEQLPPPEEPAVIPPSYSPPEPQQAPATNLVSPSPFRFVGPIILGILIIGVLIFAGSKIISLIKPKGSLPAGSKNIITLNYWGLWDSPTIMKPVIAAFEEANPNIKINYQLQSPQDYQERLKTAISGQNPPDVTRIHSTWIPIFLKDLFPAPSNMISTTEIQTNFFPFVANSVVVNNQVYGVPLNTDGLVLFLNTNMLKQKNLTAPASWEDLRSNAEKLTVRDSSTGKITRAGIALGNTTNVAHWSDIVTLMLLQAGVNPLKPDGRAVIETIGYYAAYANQNAYWDDIQPDSVVAFANEKVAMIFAPLWRIPDLQAINPSLTWETAPVPQLPDTDPVTWVSMWTEVVPKTAPHPQEAWKFVSFLASAKAQQLLFDNALKERGSAQVPVNKAAISGAQQNPTTAPLVKGLDYAKTFYTASLTRDSETGLNSRLIKYLEDAVNMVAKRNDIVQSANTLDTLSKGFNQVLNQYGLVAPLPSPTTN